ncbi:hypothetical protein IW245_006452 [Longispora fulva]|uniref:Uncharacterized protein n=1 Tax=Longispora fulva TaxID=619741 RepID=A0A8J7GNJ2_9ACTN|nr:hypothetical protein [Longispora fulva]
MISVAASVCGMALDGDPGAILGLAVAALAFVVTSGWIGHAWKETTF